MFKSKVVIIMFISFMLPCFCIADTNDSNDSNDVAVIMTPDVNGTQSQSSITDPNKLEQIALAWEEVDKADGVQTKEKDEDIDEWYKNFKVSSKKAETEYKLLRIIAEAEGATETVKAIDELINRKTEKIKDIKEKIRKVKMDERAAEREQRRSRGRDRESRERQPRERRSRDHDKSENYIDEH